MTLPVFTNPLTLRETGAGITNKDGSECPPWARLSGSMEVGPFSLHVECYAAVGVEDGAGYHLEPWFDAFAEEVEACFAALIEGTPETQQINGRWYVMRAFPFAE